MAEVQSSKGAPLLDMTPMVDLAFLLVTFFMLTATSRVSEPVIVDTPSSTSELLLPENVVLITISQEGYPFFNISNADVRRNTLERMGQQYKIVFNDEEKKRFAAMTSFGVPINQLKQYINMDDPERMKVKSTGIPHDSTNNELANWITFARSEEYKVFKAKESKAKENGTKFVQERLRFAIKADAETNYIAVKEIIDVFKDLKLYSFNLITDLEKGPTKK